MSNEINGIGTRTAQDVAMPRPIKVAPAPKEAPAPAAEDRPAVRIDPEVKRRELQQAMDRLNDQAKKNSYNLNFSFDKASNQVVVRVRTANGEVLRQIPDETALRLAEHMEDIKGLLKDEKI